MLNFIENILSESFFFNIYPNQNDVLQKLVIGFLCLFVFVLFYFGLICVGVCVCVCVCVGVCVGVLEYGSFKCIKCME